MVQQSDKFLLLVALLHVQLSLFSLAFVLTAPNSPRHGGSSTTTTTTTSASCTRLHLSSGGGGQFAMNPRETAVIMCKFQNDFASEGGKIYETVKEVMDATNMLENSKKFVNLSRKLGCQIVHCPLSTQPVWNDMICVSALLLLFVHFHKNILFICSLF
jgi:Isochorismatase family